MQDDYCSLLQAAHSPLRNYVVPGLTSYLIGDRAIDGGVMRMFVSERAQQEAITPHSHRFDFTCRVIRGQARNLIWKPRDAGDLFLSSTLIYQGEAGRYRKVPGLVSPWDFTEATYTEGQTYGMKAHEVHSIFFSRGAVIQFFEGPPVINASLILEPFVDGEVISTFEVKPWMFKRDAAA